jgi:hypothetical protein
MQYRIREAAKKYAEWYEVAFDNGLRPCLAQLFANSSDIDQWMAWSKMFFRNALFPFLAGHEPWTRIHTKLACALVGGTAVALSVVTSLTFASWRLSLAAVSLSSVAALGAWHLFRASFGVKLHPAEVGMKLIDPRDWSLGWMLQKSCASILTGAGFRSMLCGELIVTRDTTRSFLRFQNLLWNAKADRFLLPLAKKRRSGLREKP